jgi:hypothetical protein
VRTALTLALLACTAAASAYPEFQKFAQEHSGRRVDCAMCHISPVGPSGTGAGQISGLSPAEKELLTQSRNARQPGIEVKSPILNAYGNNLVKVLGGDKITEVTTEPEKLASLYDPKSDLDDDGIADAREYLDGTDPTNAQSGRPAALFSRNLRRNAAWLVTVAAGSLLLLFGLNSLLRHYQQPV